MGIKLAGIDVSGIVKTELGDKVLTDAAHVVTFHERVAGTRTPSNLGGGTNPTYTPHTCKGFIDSKNITKVKDTLVEDGDQIVVLLGDTINDGNTVPGTDDQVTAEGTRFAIKAVDRDPAAATYTLLVKAV